MKLRVQPALVHRYSVRTPLFPQAGGRAVRLQVRRVDHQSLRSARLACQAGEHFLEYSTAAPAYDTVVERLVRTVPRRGIFPL